MTTRCYAPPTPEILGYRRLCGLLERDQRALHDLTRFRTSLVNERVRAVNRLQTTLEDANIKLASVVTEVTGVSGRAILKALVAGQTDLPHLGRQCQRSAAQEDRVTPVGVSRYAALPSSSHRDGVAQSGGLPGGGSRAIRCPDHGAEGTYVVQLAALLPHRKRDQQVVNAGNVLFPVYSLEYMFVVWSRSWSPRSLRDG